MLLDSVGEDAEVSREEAVKLHANSTIKDGRSLLMLAAQYGHTNVARVLVSAKVDVNFLSRKNESALMLASRFGFDEVTPATMDPPQLISR